MGEIIMKRAFIKENIPVWLWKGVSLIKIGKGTFVTAHPIGINIRSLDVAKRMAKKFAENYDCNARLTDDLEWKKVVEFLRTNFSIKEFIEMNELDSSEALLLDSDVEGIFHVLAGGRFHIIDEIFKGFISDYDADGKVQPSKLIFLTIFFDEDISE